MKREKLLEILGWTNLNRDSKLGGYRALRGTSPQGVKNQVAPNPLKNLNAIHEIESHLYGDSQKRYIRELIDICQTPEDAIIANIEQRIWALSRIQVKNDSEL